MIGISEELTHEDKRSLEIILEKLGQEERELIPKLEQKFGRHTLPILLAYIAARPYMEDPAGIIGHLIKIKLPGGYDPKNIEQGFYELRRICKNNRWVVAKGEVSAEHLPKEALTITIKSFKQVMHLYQSTESGTL